jgi:hypothetical protein
MKPNSQPPVASRQSKKKSGYDKNLMDTVKNMVILQPKVCLTLLMKNNKWEKF